MSDDLEDLDDDELESIIRNCRVNLEAEHIRWSRSEIYEMTRQLEEAEAILERRRDDDQDD